MQNNENRKRTRDESTPSRIYVQPSETLVECADLGGAQKSGMQTWIHKMMSEGIADTRNRVIYSAVAAVEGLGVQRDHGLAVAANPNPAYAQFTWFVQTGGAKSTTGTMHAMVAHDKIGIPPVYRQDLTVLRGDGVALSKALGTFYEHLPTDQCKTMADRMIGLGTEGGTFQELYSRALGMME